MAWSCVMTWLCDAGGLAAAVADAVVCAAGIVLDELDLDVSAFEAAARLSSGPALAAGFAAGAAATFVEEAGAGESVFAACWAGPSSCFVGADVLVDACVVSELARLWEMPAMVSRPKTAMTPSAPGSQFFGFERGKKVIEAAFLLIERWRDREQRLSADDIDENRNRLLRCRKLSDISSYDIKFHKKDIAVATLGVDRDQKRSP